MADADRIVWVDLEMTGLEAETDHVLEIASLVTDGELTILAEGPELVIHQGEAVLSSMNEWSLEQHAKSGLTQRVRDSDVSLSDAEAQTLRFVKEHCAAGAAPLGGNSVHLDRSFLAVHMPALHAYLQPENIDVSTLKELVRRWYPAAFDARPPKADSHRALDDIRESIEELRYYRKSVFR